MRSWSNPGSQGTPYLTTEVFLLTLCNSPLRPMLGLAIHDVHPTASLAAWALLPTGRAHVRRPTTGTGVRWLVPHLRDIVVLSVIGGVGIYSGPPTTVQGCG